MLLLKIWNILADLWCILLAVNVFIMGCTGSIFRDSCRPIAVHIFLSLIV